ncbi:putative pci domain containing protein [Eutypa lata UCREL1]|uniref:Eukaryotic translation initiation factor 3 subunit M n=1 Tax=Eutypa lata (strain UCR-EL1) TaxID=1287681 RepID=M7T5B6_EUTLA|nr:putative pci domain containing protein [Eutypa lata UCREL1]
MAAPTQPQLVFVDGSFADLAQEMADYLSVGDEVKPLLEKDDKDEVLKKIIIASPALNAKPEKEFTAAYNLLVYLVLQSENVEKFLPRVCENLTKPITSSPVNGPGLALNALSNIFNLLQPENELRYNVFQAIVRFVKQNGFFENIKKYLPSLDTWCQQWETDEEDQRRLYEQIAEAAHDASDEKTSYEYILKALRLFEESELKSEEAQRFSLRAVKTALLSPTHYDFQDLLALPSVQALSDSHPVYFELLEIFAEKDLEDYNDFNEEHEGFIEKEHLDGERLYRKMRLLTFASLAASISSREIPYSSIAKALLIPTEDVELWTIDVIRSGLVEGKLSQQKQVFLVHRTTYRVFSEKQWRELGDRIDSWRSVLRNVAITLRKEQANAEAQKKREQDDLERKMVNASVGGGMGDARGGRRGGGDRAPRKERNDNDD